MDNDLTFVFVLRGCWIVEVATGCYFTIVCALPSGRCFGLERPWEMQRAKDGISWRRGSEHTRSAGGPGRSLWTWSVPFVKLQKYPEKPRLKFFARFFVCLLSVCLRVLSWFTPKIRNQISPYRLLKNQLGHCSLIWTASPGGLPTYPYPANAVAVRPRSWRCACRKQYVPFCSALEPKWGHDQIEQTLESSDYNWNAIGTREQVVEGGGLATFAFLRHGFLQGNECLVMALMWCLVQKWFIQNAQQLLDLGQYRGKNKTGMETTPEQKVHSCYPVHSLQTVLRTINLNCKISFCNTKYSRVFSSYIFKCYQHTTPVHSSSH